MDETSAVTQLSAIAHETRLKVFRLLAARGEAGAPAGEIARLIGVPATTMSAHLAILARAGLINAARESRVIRYRISPAGVRGLITYLTSECCGGRLELCAPAPRQTGALQQT